MCRHLAYLGPPTDLATLLLDPPHSLLRQSWAPNDMRCAAVVNADGFGAGWYPDGRARPVRYRRVLPMWADPSFADLADSVHATAVVAAVRSATVGMPVVETACQPFTADRWLFSHNGMVAGWPDSLAKLAAALPVTDLVTLDAPTDSALLWALLADRLRSGQPMSEAVGTLVLDVLAAAPESRLNLLLCDGTTVAATAVHHSLWVRRTTSSVLVASEPTDGADGWQPVPDRHLLVASTSELDIRPLDTLSTTAEEPS